MNLAMQAPAAEVYFDNAKVSSAINPGTWASSYSSLTPGNFAVNFKKSGADSLMATISTNTYDSAKFYSLILYNDQPSSAKAYRTIDDFSLITYDKPYIRFFHLSQNTPPVDFYLNATKLASGRGLADNIITPEFNSFTGYNIGIYSVQAKLAGTDSVVASTNNVSLQAGGAYTIFLLGLTKGTGNNVLAINFIQAQK